MIKHHLVQMMPVVVRAAFWVRERDSAGRAKSETPTRTRPHFIIGALAGREDVLVADLDRGGGGKLISGANIPKVHSLGTLLALPELLHP